MSNIYRLILIEDDAAYAASLHQALNKQHLYTLPVEIRTITYAEFKNQVKPTRNSSREILVFGGHDQASFAPDITLLKKMLARHERSHFFVLTSAEDGKAILSLWQPGISGVLERGPEAKDLLFSAVQRIQLRQQVRNSGQSYVSNRPKKGFLAQVRAAFFSFFA